MWPVTTLSFRGLRPTLAQECVLVFAVTGHALPQQSIRCRRRIDLRPTYRGCCKLLLPPFCASPPTVTQRRALLRRAPVTRTVGIDIGFKSSVHVQPSALRR